MTMLESATSTRTLIGGAARVGTNPRAISESGAVSPFLRFIHRQLVAPLVRPFSSWVVRRSVRPFFKEVRTAMVVAAGDDPFAVELAALGIRTSINDIDTEALSHLSQLAVKHRVQLDAVYGDVRDLVLDEPVDVVFIKNLLHHLVDVEDAARVLRHLQSQARRLVVVEIRDPRAELLARLWNAYYRLMLADDGCNFIGPSAFASIVRSADPKATIRTTRTIKGTYLIASLRGAHADSSLELSGRRAFLDSSDT